MFKYKVRLFKEPILHTTMLEVKLYNVVGGGPVGVPISLDMVAKWDGATYEPQVFPGVRLRLADCTVQLFRTGKIVVVGAKSEDAVYSAMDKTVDRLRGCGIRAAGAVSEIYNVVGTANLGTKLDPSVVVLSVPKSMYEPEHFPGVIIRRQYPRCTILLFASGKIVCVGAKSAKSARDAVNQMHADLVGLGLA